MAIGPASLSFEDLLALEGDDDTCVRQLIEGTVVATPSPSTRHQLVLAELSRALGNHVKAHDLGILMFAPMDVVLRSERAATQKDLRALTDRAKNIINSFEAPDPSELLGKTADHDAAEVGIAFEHSSECSGIF